MSVVATGEKVKKGPSFILKRLKFNFMLVIQLKEKETVDVMILRKALVGVLQSLQSTQ